MTKLVPDNSFSLDAQIKLAPETGFGGVGPMENTRDDAALIAECELFQQQHAEFLAALGDDADSDGKLRTRWLTSDLIQPMRPATPAGILAKAVVALVLLTTSGRDQDGDGDIQFVLAALRDVVAAPLAA